MTSRSYGGRSVVLASLVLALLLCVLSPVKAQTEPEQTTAKLYVIVLYDRDNDGEVDGVGSGTPVYIRESASDQSFVNVTDPNSQAGFLVAGGRTYILDAFPAQTRPFYRWVCHDSVLVEKAEQYKILYCEDYFFINLPWAGWS